MSTSQKRFEPTARKLRKAQESGDCSKSRELTAVLALGVGLLIIFKALVLLEEIPKLFQQLLGGTTDLSIESMLVYALSAAKAAVIGIFPVLLGVLVVAVMVETLQRGAYFSFKFVKFDFSRLNIFLGLKRNFLGIEGQQVAPLMMLTQVGKYSLLLIIGTLVLISSSFGKLGVIFQTDYAQGQTALAVIYQVLFELSCSLIAVLLIFAVYDYWSARRRWRKKLMMDVEELKREFRETEGSPELKSARKQMHRELAVQQIIEGVRKAKVVVVDCLGK